jgi:hypothetical protein
MESRKQKEPAESFCLDCIKSKDKYFRFDIKRIGRIKREDMKIVLY